MLWAGFDFLAIKSILRVLSSESQTTLNESKEVLALQDQKMNIEEEEMMNLWEDTKSPTEKGDIEMIIMILEVIEILLLQDVLKNIKLFFMILHQFPTVISHPEII